MLLEFAHLEGPTRGDRTPVRGARILLGSDAAADVRLTGAGVLVRHAEIEVTGTTALLQPHGPVRLNDRTVGDVQLRDGDVLTLGEARLRVRLRPEEHDRARDYHALLGRAAASDVPVGSSRPAHAKAAAAATALFLVILVTGAYLGARTQERPDPVEAERGRAEARSQARERAYRREIASLTGELRNLEDRVATGEELATRVGEVQRAVAEVEDQVLSRVQRTLDASARDTMRRMESQDRAPERIIAAHKRGVCLIQGAYAFGKSEDGAWKFLREASPELLADLEIDADKVPLMLEGDGPVFRVEYTGTGFLADKGGIVLTNRHIAQPWWRNDAAKPLLADGYEPRFLRLRAYFPGHDRPVEFDREKTVVSEDADLAALFFAPDRVLPDPLPLAETDQTIPGRRVFLLGYPAGLDALLARCDDSLTRRLSRDARSDPMKLLDLLAQSGMVRPLTTQGIVADISADKIVYDAATAVGGSGGPLVDLEGNVVAINYGILKAFSGANFGVPVAHARALIERARTD